jgi:hypothetical protein
MEAPLVTATSFTAPFHQKSLQFRGLEYALNVLPEFGHSNKNTTDIFDEWIRKRVTMHFRGCSGNREPNWRLYMQIQGFPKPIVISSEGLH